MVRRPLSPLLRLTLGVLIVTDVHAKDIVDALVRERVSSVHDFEWISQMRYYFQK